MLPPTTTDATVVSASPQGPLPVASDPTIAPTPKSTHTQKHYGRFHYMVFHPTDSSLSGLQKTIGMIINVALFALFIIPGVVVRLKARKCNHNHNYINFKAPFISPNQKRRLPNLDSVTEDIIRNPRKDLKPSELRSNNELHSKPSSGDCITTLTNPNPTTQDLRDKENATVVADQLPPSRITTTHTENEIDTETEITKSNQPITTPSTSITHEQQLEIEAKILVIIAAALAVKASLSIENETRTTSKQLNQTTQDLSDNLTVGTDGLTPNRMTTQEEEEELVVVKKYANRITGDLLVRSLAGIPTTETDTEIAENDPSIDRITSPLTRTVNPRSNTAGQQGPLGRAGEFIRTGIMSLFSRS